MAAPALDMGEFFLDFFVALGVGALVGLEREHRRDQTQVIAGVRTFPLFSLAGYMLAIVAREVGENAAVLLAAGVLGMAAIAIAFLWVRHQLGVTGLTTPMAMLVVFFLGVLIGYDRAQAAIVIGVATTFLLLTKERLHGFAAALDDEEVMGALQFITVVFILFPIVQALHAPVLEQAWLGRGALVDPYFTLLVVIFVSSMSFASFLAMRTVGARRGVAVSGLLGGLVNSEATSASLAGYANESESLVRPAVIGALLATTTMFVRNLAIAAFADPSLAVARAMLPVLAPMAALGAALATWRYWRHRRREQDGGRVPRVKNPFALAPAVRFALLFLGISVAARVGTSLLGPAGVFATALGGVVSAGAVIATVCVLYVKGDASLQVAALTAILATVIGAANKLVVLRAANAQVFRKAGPFFVALTAVGVIGVIALAILGVPGT